MFECFRKLLTRPKNPPVLQVFQDMLGTWRYRCRGANGEIMLTSEAYDSHSNATRAARTLIANPPREFIL